MLPPTFSMVYLLHRLYGVDAPVDWSMSYCGKFVTVESIRFAGNLDQVPCPGMLNGILTVLDHGRTADRLCLTNSM